MLTCIIGLICLYEQRESHFGIKIIILGKSKGDLGRQGTQSVTHLDRLAGGNIQEETGWLAGMSVGFFLKHCFASPHLAGCGHSAPLWGSELLTLQGPGWREPGGRGPPAGH